jgi:transcriptional regulator with XRE-family HTH domain
MPRNMYAVWQYTFSMGFRENLKSELVYQDMKAKELAALTGISRHTLDNFLNVRNRIPAADAAVKIARVLGVSVEYLILNKKQPVPQETREIISTLRRIAARNRRTLVPGPFRITSPFAE